MGRVPQALILADASLKEDTENTWKKNSIGSAGTKMSMHMSGGWFCISSK